MTGAQPILTYTVLYTYVIFVMLHWHVIGLCGLVVRILDGTSRCPGFESRQVKNIFASIMLTEIISLISKHDFDLELLERS